VFTSRELLRAFAIAKCYKLSHNVSNPGIWIRHQVKRNTNTLLELTLLQLGHWTKWRSATINYW